MIRKIMILITLFSLDGCVFIGFDKGIYPNKILGFEEDIINQNVVLKNQSRLYIEFSGHECGYYGLIGIVIPFIPYWSNYDCDNFHIDVRRASKVYLKYKDTTYNYSELSPKSYYNYTFPIPVKSLSDGATLVIETDKQKFEIPFQYQHKFNFQLWGS